jgi:N-acetylglucosaminyl-diphospho-decaprenol L-rhamnosyltransferase
MKLFISIVNHNHDDLISANLALKQVAKHHKVIIKSNSLASEGLKTYCHQSGIEIIQGRKNKGFSENNNEIFNFCTSNYKMDDDDYFLVINPDVTISNDEINRLIKLACKEKSDISSINLYKDKDKTIYDNSIRHHPKLSSPIRTMFKIKRNDIYDKSKILSPQKIEWAAGSFLLFKASCYTTLNGFDEKYFMYFEDADICRRANNLGMFVMYFPQIKAIHYASHKNRAIFSRHFIWYLQSSLRYHLKFFKCTKKTEQR